MNSLLFAASYPAFGSLIPDYKFKAMTKDFRPTIYDLYPDLSDAERAQAEDNLDRYLALAIRIFERLESDTNPQADALTAGTGTLPCTSPKPGSSIQSNQSL